MAWLVLFLGAGLLTQGGVFGAADLINVKTIFVYPNHEHWFGTDAMGRDLLIRVLRGSGMSIIICVQALCALLVMSVLYGGISGWYGGFVDRVLMVLLDIWLSVPSSVLAVLFSLLILGHNESVWAVSLVIGFTHWGRLARVVRGEVIHLRSREFIKVTETMGASGFQILFHQVLPHLTGIVSISVVYQIPNLVMTESFLSFIGIGVQPPETSWGILLQEGWRSLQVYPHVVLFPALCLFLTILAINTTLLDEADPIADRGVW